MSLKGILWTEHIDSFRPPTQWIFIVSAFVLLGLFSGLNFLFGIFLNPLISEFSWNRSTASAAYSINMFMIAFSSIIAGGLSDKFGTRPVLLAGVLIAGGSLILSFFIQNLWQYLLLTGVLAGLGAPPSPHPSKPSYSAT